MDNKQNYRDVVYSGNNPNDMEDLKNQNININIGSNDLRNNRVEGDIKVNEESSLDGGNNRDIGSDNKNKPSLKDVIEDPVINSFIFFLEKSNS